jgi:hypothetical protein
MTRAKRVFAIITRASLNDDSRRIANRETRKPKPAEDGSFVFFLRARRWLMGHLIAFHRATTPQVAI